MTVRPSEGQSTSPQDFQTDRNINLYSFLLNSLWISIKGQKVRRKMAVGEKKITKTNIL